MYDRIYSKAFTIITTPPESKFIPGSDFPRKKYRSQRLEEALSSKLPEDFDSLAAMHVFDIFTEEATALNEAGISNLSEMSVKASTNPKYLSRHYLQISKGSDIQICCRIPHYFLPQLRIMERLQEAGIQPPRLRIIQTTASQLTENSKGSDGRNINRELLIRNSAIAVAFLREFIAKYYPQQNDRVEIVDLPSYDNIVREFFVLLYGLIPQPLTTELRKIAESRGGKPDAYVGRHAFTYSQFSRDRTVSCGGRTELEFWRAAERIGYEIEDRRDEVLAKLDGNLRGYLPSVKENTMLIDACEKVFIGFGTEPGYYCQSGEPDLFRRAEGHRDIDPSYYIENGNHRKLGKLRREYSRLIEVTGGGYDEFVERFVEQIPDKDVVEWSISRASNGVYTNIKEWERYCVKLFQERLGWPKYK